MNEYQETFESNTEHDILDWYIGKHPEITSKDLLAIMDNPEKFKVVAYDYWSEYFGVPIKKT